MFTKRIICFCPCCQFHALMRIMCSDVCNECIKGVIHRIRRNPGFKAREAMIVETMWYKR
jgi:hypothetical protein